MKEKNTLRVAVGKPQAMQSSIWRFWAQKNEVYVAARESVRVLKLSLHSSGIWRLAYISEKEINDPLITDSDPRVLARWARPLEFTLGWTRGFDVIIPATLIKKHFSAQKKDILNKDICWMKELPEGHKQQITILFADSGSRKIEEVAQNGDELLGQFNLDDGRVAWIVARKSKMSEVERDYVEKFAEDMKINYESDPGKQVFAATMMVNKTENHPIITNFALGWENVHVGEVKKIKS